MLSHTVSTKCIREFCQVTGSDEETARSFLSACNNNLELAVSLYMDDPSRVPSQSPTEEYRTPIPQRNEQLLPVVVPLLPVHLQNAPLMQTRRRAFVAEDSDDNSDDDTVTSGAKCQPFEKSQSASKSDHSTKQRCSNVSGPNPTLLNTDGTSSGSSSFSSRHTNGVKDSVNKRKRKHLQQLYQPPVEILFDGTVHAAELAAQEKNQWLLVSIHDEGCFECHLLNRDVWKDPKIYQLIKRHCTFVQIPVDSSEGLRFRSSYSYVQSASHIAILDPFTGEQKMMWTHLNDPKIVYDVLYQFIQHTTLTNPNNNTNINNTTAINNGQDSSSIGSINLTGNGRTDSTSIDNRFTNSVLQSSIRRRPAEVTNAEMHEQFDHFNLKRPRLQTSDNVYPSEVEYIDLSNSVHSSQINCTTTNPLDLTEEEQLQLAIEASKKEAKRQLSNNEDEIVLTDDDDDDDDDDEEYMNGNKRSDTGIDQQQRDHKQDKEQLSHNTYEDDDCIVVNYPKKPSSSSFVSSTTAFITARRPLRPPEKLNESTSNNDLKSDILTELPTPAPGEAVIELLFRLPDGNREVHRLHPTLKLQDLHSYFEYRGYPFNKYEIVRIHPNLCLSSMHQSISLTVAGLCTKDTLFIQER
uniref:UBX domain-containing protein n=1 Tax=Schistosoma mansoni TaxID=6183 RepID=A0A5K4F1B5_SCHMA